MLSFSSSPRLPLLLSVSCGPRTSLRIVPLTSPVSRMPVHALLSRLVPSTLPTQTPQRGNLTGLAYPVWAESACRATDIQLPPLSSRLHRTGAALGEASPSLHRGGRHHLGRRELRGRPPPAARRVADTVPRTAARGPDRVAPSTWRGVRGPGGGPAEFGVCVVVTPSGRRAWALAEGGLGGPGQASASSGCPSGGRAHLAKIRGAVRVGGEPFSVYVMLHLKVLVT